MAEPKWNVLEQGFRVRHNILYNLQIMAKPPMSNIVIPDDRQNCRVIVEKNLVHGKAAAWVSVEGSCPKLFPTFSQRLIQKL